MSTKFIDLIEKEKISSSTEYKIGLDFAQPDEDITISDRYKISSRPSVKPVMLAQTVTTTSDLDGQPVTTNSTANITNWTNTTASSTLTTVTSDKGYTEIYAAQKKSKKGRSRGAK